MQKTLARYLTSVLTLLLVFCIVGTGTICYAAEEEATGFALTLGEEEPITNVTVYDLPLPPAPEGQVFVGWYNAAGTLFLPAGAAVTLTEDLTLYPFFLTLSTTAQLRIGETFEELGIRFLTETRCSEIEALRTHAAFTLGTLISPTTQMPTAKSATHAALVSKGYSYLDVPTNGPYRTEEDVYCFAGSVTRMLPENYGRAYYGLGYLSVTYSNGEQKYVYAPRVRTNARSIYALVSEAFCDRTEEADEAHVFEVKGGYSPYTEAQCAWFETYLARVININVSMDTAHVVTALPQTPYYTAPYEVSKFDSRQESFTFTVAASETYDFRDCVALLVDGILCRLATEEDTHDVVTRRNKYYIEEDGTKLYYYYSEYTPSY